MEMERGSEGATPLLEPDLPARIGKIAFPPSKNSPGKLLLLFNIFWTLTLLYLTRSFSTDCNPISVPSPLLQAIDQRLEMRTMSGSIHDDGSIFRQGPSDEVDKAWAWVAFDDYELINVTEADIIASGKDPTTRVRWDPSIDSYPAQIEFAHQIHCLDVVRKEIWGERYFGNTKYTLKARRRMHRQHTMHCLHMLLQNLMCNLDLGIVTHDWIPGNTNMESSPFPRPFADFSTKKMCPNFGPAADWVHKNAVRKGDKTFSELTPPPGVRVAERNDSYWP
ncbi:hypothetical protein B0T25DRAFT_481231 [Lasiosphaeria hispida]|uniref:Uncharacterized protein n=1 Tax=Lasiosphaeria hispida TaxID=260671 RepID=A0AAJ0HE92_9PEZI|nr:hypothetical protein B0T25DRAFT_481231 [Lasiosphaeria hispida]